MNWGQDLAKTAQLVRDLKLDERVIWEPVSSRPLLLQKMRAADVVCDQLVMNGFGTAVVEALLAGTPVITNVMRADIWGKNSPAPILEADSEDSPVSRLTFLYEKRPNDELRRLSSEWAIRERYSSHLAVGMLENILEILNSTL